MLSIRDIKYIILDNSFPNLDEPTDLVTKAIIKGRRLGGKGEAGRSANEGAGPGPERDLQVVRDKGVRVVEGDQCHFMESFI